MNIRNKVLNVDSNLHNNESQLETLCAIFGIGMRSLLSPRNELKL